MLGALMQPVDYHEVLDAPTRNTFGPPNTSARKSQYQSCQKMKSILLVLALALSVTAQFQFFEQFFGGEQQHQQPQNVPSDSSWYKQNYAKGL